MKRASSLVRGITFLQVEFQANVIRAGEGDPEVLSPEDGILHLPGDALRMVFIRRQACDSPPG